MRVRMAWGMVLLASAVLTGCSTEHVSNLKPGDCFNVQVTGTTQEIGTVPTVDCAKEHSAEVYLVTDLDSASIPAYDEDEVAYAGYEKCVDAFEGYTGADFWSAEAADLDLYLIYPLAAGWGSGDRGITCAIVSINPGEKLTGSMKNSLAAG